ncbi:MAG TPA: GNAT family protein [Gaiellaceae bacterium]|nr:GNAT family protein [Gaiellaceae bacterium]
MIRPLVPADAEELAAVLMANRHVFEPIMADRSPDYYTAAYQRERLERYANPSPENEAWLFAILEGDAIVGTLNMGDVIRSALQRANIGYWIDESHYGRGLATGAVAAAVEFAFGEAGLHRLAAATLPDNVASQRVLEKNGFSQFGIAHKLVMIGGVWRDHVLYERIADD